MKKYLVSIFGTKKIGRKKQICFSDVIICCENDDKMTAEFVQNIKEQITEIGNYTDRVTILNIIPLEDEQEAQE